MKESFFVDAGDSSDSGPEQIRQILFGNVFFCREICEHIAPVEHLHHDDRIGLVPIRIFTWH
jgi:hypothetical protein